MPQQQQGQQQMGPQQGGFQILPWMPQTVDGMVPPSTPPVTLPSPQIPSNPVNSLPFDWQLMQQGYDSHWQDPSTGLTFDAYGNIVGDTSPLDIMPWLGWRPDAVTIEAPLNPLILR